jgi:hypothetical protein
MKLLRPGGSELKSRTILVSPIECRRPLGARGGQIWPYKVAEGGGGTGPETRDERRYDRIFQGKPNKPFSLKVVRERQI